MPHLLNFIKSQGTLFDNEHTPLISHTAHDLLTGLTGVYADQHGIGMNNSFEYYNNSSVGAYNTLRSPIGPIGSPRTRPIRRASFRWR
jgi:hypothetical protein